MGTAPSLSQNLLRSVTYKSYYAGEREKNIREEFDTASPVVTFVTVAGFVCLFFKQVLEKVDVEQKMSIRFLH